MFFQFPQTFKQLFLYLFGIVFTQPVAVRSLKVNNGRQIVFGQLHGADKVLCLYSSVFVEFEKMIRPYYYISFLCLFPIGFKHFVNKTRTFGCFQKRKRNLTVRNKFPINIALMGGNIYTRYGKTVVIYCNRRTGIIFPVIIYSVYICHARKYGNDYKKSRDNYSPFSQFLFLFFSHQSLKTLSNPLLLPSCVRVCRPQTHSGIHLLFQS